MTLAFAVAQKSVPVLSRTGAMLRYPVRRIYCICLNYESHTREMGSTARSMPVFFTKPADTIAVAEDNYTSMTSTLSIRYPPMTESYHHEVELVAAIGPSTEAADGYSNVAPEAVPAIIYGYAVGLDMTRRDLQAQAKEQGMPWDIAKGAEDAAVISSIVRAADLRERAPHLFVTNTAAATDATNTDHHNDRSHSHSYMGSTTTLAPLVTRGELHLCVNGTRRQSGDVSNMITPLADVVSVLSKFVTLRAGDLVYTGTPAGVGPVRRGDVIVAGVEDVGNLHVTVV